VTGGTAKRQGAIVIIIASRRVRKRPHALPD